MKDYIIYIIYERFHKF